MAVGAAPVCDDDPVESPFVTQDVFEQMRIFIGICTVYLIVTRHDCFCAAFFYGNFEPGEVNFPEGTLIQNGIHCHTPKFLAVHCKMFGTCIDTALLDSADIGCGHLSCKIGVFRKIFEVPSA